MQSKDLNYWIELIYRRRGCVSAVAGVVFAVIVVGTLLWPPVYKSSAEIMIQDNRAQLLVSPDLRDDSPQRPAVVSNPVTEEDLNSESQLLTSLFLVKQAIAGLPVPSGYSGPGAELMHLFKATMALPSQGYRMLHRAPAVTPTDRWALALATCLDSDVLKRSDLIEVTFKSHDADWCQKFLALLLNRYLDYHAKISHDPQAERFFQEQAWMLQEKLATAEHQLEQFQLQTGISDFNGHQQALISRLSELQLERSKTAAELSSADRQVAALSMQLKRTSPRIGKETKSVQNLALQQLKPQVMSLKAERAELLSRYQPSSARIREIDAKLAAAQKILDLENHLEVTEQSTDLNPVWVTLDTNLEESKTTAASLQATLKTLDDEINAGKGQLSFLVNQSPELSRLQRQIASNREAYLSYVRKTEEARAAGALNTNKILNVSVVQPPLRPVRPVFPNVWLNIMAGMVLALVLGVAAAELDERGDERIYSTVTVARETGLETVVVLASQG